MTEGAGEWWAPDRPEQRYPGTIDRSKKRLVLRVRDAVLDQTAYRAFDRRPVVHGVDADGTPVTLWDTDFLQDDGFDHDRNEQLWRVRTRFVLTGAHLESRDTATFGASEVVLPQLEMWSRHPRTADPHPAPPSEFAAVDLGLLYGTETRVSAQIVRPQVVRRGGDRPMVDPAHTGSAAAIRFELATPAAAEFHDRLAHDAQDLMTFVRQDRSIITGRRLFTPDGDAVLVDYERQVKPRAAPVPATSFLVAPVYVPVEAIFRWWEVRPELYPVTEVLAGRYYSDNAYVEHHVIAAVGALEGLHDKLGLERNLMPEKKFRALRTKYARDAEADGHTAFGNFLRQQTPRVTLRTKLNRLADRLGDEAMNAATVTRDSWVNAVMKTRNRIAHTGSHVTGFDPPEGGDLLRVADWETRAVVSLIVLQELGIAGADLTAAAERLGRTRGVEVGL